MMEPNSISITIFEGSDCCGKTTQATMLLNRISSENEQERRIYVHFPRIHYAKIKDLYKNTMETVYNNTFMQDLFLTDTTENNKNDKELNYGLLKRVLVDNVIINADEKISFLKSIYMIKKGFVNNDSDYLELLLDEWSRQSETYKMCIQKDGAIENISSNNINEFMNYENACLPLHFIFDRFDYSGLCYNVFIIQKTLETYKNNHNSAKIDELIFMLNRIQEEKTKEIEEWKLILESLNVNIRYIFFKPSEIIEKKVKNEKARETDDYDNCRYISEFGKIYFGNLTALLSENVNIKIRNAIGIDTDAKIKDFINSSGELKWCEEVSSVVQDDKELIHKLISAFVYYGKYDNSNIATKCFHKII